MKRGERRAQGAHEIGFLTIRELFKVNEDSVFVRFVVIFLRRKMVLTPDGRGGSRPQRLGLSLSKPARTMSVSEPRTAGEIWHFGSVLLFIKSRLYNLGYDSCWN